MTPQLLKQIKTISKQQHHNATNVIRSFRLSGSASGNDCRHLGTVDSDLSKPFQGNIPDEKLFTPEYSVQKLLRVLEKLTPAHSGKCFAWDGEEILP